MVAGGGRLWSSARRCCRPRRGGTRWWAVYGSRGRRKGPIYRPGGQGERRERWPAGELEDRQLMASGPAVVLV